MTLAEGFYEPCRKTSSWNSLWGGGIGLDDLLSLCSGTSGICDLTCFLTKAGQVGCTLKECTASQQSRLPFQSMRLPESKVLK